MWPRVEVAVNLLHINVSAMYIQVSVYQTLAIYSSMCIHEGAYTDLLHNDLGEVLEADTYRHK